MLQSAVVPAPTAKGGEKLTPARKRRIHNPANEGEKPAPKVNMTPSGGEMK